MLFDPGAHEHAIDAAWSPASVEAEIRTIARDADAALRPGEWWAWHPLDVEPGDPDVTHGVYLGAAGVLWALDRLARAGLHEPGHDYGRLAGEVLASYLERPDFGGLSGSVWLGEGGIALVAWLLAPSASLADRLFEIVSAESSEPDTLELMWGSPGLLLVADAALERSGEPRWAAAWSALAERLMAAPGERVPGLWTQRLRGRDAEEILGAAHGSAGVVAALARRPELLPPERLVPEARAAFGACAVRDGGLANWPPSFRDPLAEPDGSIRTQWCHGAPGVVTSLVALPPGDAELDALLVAGGELTWAAGPLRKGPGLCHGTAGNGFALLALLARTGDERWLRRARRFAMHAAAQVGAARERYGHGRHTLWTGDLGTAIYLAQCLEAAYSGMPALDMW